MRSKVRKRVVGEEPSTHPRSLGNVSANRQYMRACPEKAREARQRYRQLREAHCQPLCVVLSRDPRIKTAAQKLRAQSREAPTPQRALRSREAALAVRRRYLQEHCETLLAQRHAYDRRYYQEHRETVLARMRVRQRTDRERATRCAYARKNKERLNANRRTWYSRNLEEVHAKNRERYRKHKRCLPSTTLNIGKIRRH